MLVRRLLIAGGGSSFALPAPSEPFEVVAAPDAGGLIEVSGPHAAYRAGRTAIVWIGGNSKINDVQIIARVDGAAAGVYEGPVTLHDNLSDGASTSPDSHNTPAVGINPDGTVLVVYMGHVSTTIRARVSNAALGSGWVAAGFTTEYTWTPISGSLTYPQLAYVASIDRWYLFARAGGSLVRCHSDNRGRTWGNGTAIYTSGTGNFYSAFAADGSDRIDFAVTDKEADNGNYGTFHFWMDPITGDLNAADGSTLVADADLPAVPGDLTQLEAISGGDAYPYSVAYTDDGRPVVTWQTKATTPISFGEFRWTGSAWVKRTIGTSDLLNGTIESVGGGAHDWNGANRFITGKIVSGTIHVYRYTTADDGATWSGASIATATCAPSPVYVHNAGAELAWIWFSEGFTHSSDFDPGLAGVA